MTVAPRLEIIPLSGLPMFETGDSLADAILAGLDAFALVDDDVIVVAQKIVSKVEGRTVALADIVPGEAALAIAGITGKLPTVAQLMLDEGEVMRARPNVAIMRHRLGHVAANSGIDASNLPGGGTEQVLLWPVDPDASAQALRTALMAATGRRLAVIVADSLGRAWRIGTIGTAIGSAGLLPLTDRRGERDLYGRELLVTMVAVADSIAAAAVLAMGEGDEGLPVAIVRGATYLPDENARATALVRPPHEDMFP